jgi:hypothetical protein
VLVFFVIVPLYRLLATPDAGPFLSGALDIAETSRTLLFYGSLIVVAVGVAVSRLLDPAWSESKLSGLGERVAAIPVLRFAVGVGLVAACITFGFSIIVLDGKPNLIDAMVQLLHAKFFASGHLSGPANEFLEFWQVQNSLVTAKGWVSQYPPGYVTFLALGLRLGVPQAVGPFFVGVAVVFTALAAERLLPDDRATARLGVVMLGLSPFLIGLAGAYMNHVAAAAFFSAAIFFAARSLDSRNHLWPVLAGLAVGIVFSIRPLTAVVASLVVAVVWLLPPEMTSAGAVSRFLRRFVGAVIGIFPIFVALGLYNQHFFGSPFRFGYVASQGPHTGLGFHLDPTGHLYGPLQSLGYTSADLLTLSLYLFETPIPAVLVVGVFFLFARRLSRGERVIACWALLPVVANAFYWHHGSFMGPRMLNEATPGWALLAAVAAVGLVRRVPAEKMLGNYSPRLALSSTLLVGWFAGVFFLGPQRLWSYGGPWLESGRIKIPAVPRQPALIFVHGGWTGRIAMRLLAHGMRLDSLESAVRYNLTCDSYNYSLWYAQDPARRPPTHPQIYFDFRQHRPTSDLHVAEGDEIRIGPDVRMPPACLRQIASDTLGIVEVAPLLWQSEVPGTTDAGTMVVRDLGPELNSRLIARYPERLPLVLYRPRKEGAPELAPYAVGMAALWPAR